MKHIAHGRVVGRSSVVLPLGNFALQFRVRPDSPFSEEIYPDWEKLVVRKDRVLDDGRTPHPDQVAGWQVLYGKTLRDGVWLVSAPDAGLVASLGVTIALQERRYEDAASLAQQYLDHPEAPKSDEMTWESFSVRLGTALILSERMEEGIGILDRVLEDEGRSKQTRHLVIRGEILWTLMDLGKELGTDSRLAEFVGRLFETWEDLESKAVLARKVSTNGKLIEIIQSTYPTRE